MLLKYLVCAEERVHRELVCSAPSGAGVGVLSTLLSELGRPTSLVPAPDVLKSFPPVLRCRT